MCEKTRDFFGSPNFITEDRNDKTQYFETLSHWYSRMRHNRQIMGCDAQVKSAEQRLKPLLTEKVCQWICRMAEKLNTINYSTSPYPPFPLSLFLHVRFWFQSCHAIPSGFDSLAKYLCCNDWGLWLHNTFYYNHFSILALPLSSSSKALKNCATCFL